MSHSSESHGTHDLNIALEQSRTDSAVSPVRELFAVLMNGNWSIAHRVSASSYGEDTGEEVWSEQGSTAWLGLVGKEEVSIPLSRRSLDTADGVEDAAAYLVSVVDKFMGVLGPGGYFPAAGASLTNHLESANNQLRARLAFRTPNTEMVVKAEPVAWLEREISALLADAEPLTLDDAVEMDWLRDRLEQLLAKATEVL